MNNLFDFLSSKNDCELLIVSDDIQAQIASDIAAFKGLKPFVLSDFRANFGDDLLSFSEELQQITKSLSSYYREKNKKLLIAPIRTASFAMPKAKCFDSFDIEFASTIDLTDS